MPKKFYSPSALGIFRSCPRCFWLDKKMKLKRPDGIKASLPSGMDGVIKIYFDDLRKAKKVPEGLKGQLYQDQEQLDKWRNWRNWATTDLCYETDTVRLGGFLDDLFVEEDGTYSPYDYKTRGTLMKGTPEDYGRKYYQSQMDIYALLLKSRKMKISGFAYLNFFYPTEMKSESAFAFKSVIAKLEVNPDNGIKLLEDALKCLASDTMPKAAEDCEYCAMVEARKSLK